MDRDPLAFREFLQRLAPTEPSVARGLDPAERHPRVVEHGRAVDVADSDLDATEHLGGRRFVGAEDRGDEPEFGVVGDRQSLFPAAYACDPGDWAECLFGKEPHSGRDLVEHRRLQSTPRKLTAADKPGALSQCVIDQRADSDGCGGADEGPERWWGTGGEAQFRDPGGQALDERVRNGVFDDNPLGRHADLALIEKAAEGGGFGCAIQIGIGKNDHRALAAELQKAGFEVSRGTHRDVASDAGRSGEVDTPDRGVCDKGVNDLPGLIRRIRDVVQDARRQTGVIQNLSNPLVRFRAKLRAFQDHGIPTGERRRDRAGRERHGGIPGRYSQHHTCRTPTQQITALLKADIREGVDQIRGLSQHVAGDTDVEAHPVRRGSDLLGGDLLDLVQSRAHQVGRASENDLPFPWISFGPGHEGASCRIRRVARLIRRKGGRLRDDLVRQGVTPFELARQARRHGATVNYEMGLEQLPLPKQPRAGPRHFLRVLERKRCKAGCVNDIMRETIIYLQDSPMISASAPINLAPSIRSGRHEGRLQARVIGRAESLSGPSWMLLLLQEGEAAITGPDATEKLEAPAVLWRQWGLGQKVRLAPGTVAAHVVAGSNTIANAIGHKPESQDLRELMDHDVTVQLDRTSPAFNTARACFDAVHRETEAGGPAATTLIEAYLRILVVEIWRSQRTEDRVTPSGNAPSQRIFNQFTTLVELHFRNRWTVERYASAMGLSRDRLGDICQRIRGRGPKEIIDRRTLREARLLLETSTSSVEQIAGRLGFQSAAQFNRFFRRLAGLPPGRARRAAGRDDIEAVTATESTQLHDWP